MQDLMNLFKITLFIEAIVTFYYFYQNYKVKSFHERVYDKGKIWFQRKFKNIQIRSCDKNAVYETTSGVFKIIDSKRISFFAKNIEHPFPRMFRGTIIQKNNYNVS